jgi:hypothetical protein
MSPLFQDRQRHPMQERWWCESNSACRAWPASHDGTRCSNYADGAGPGDPYHKRLPRQSRPAALRHAARARGLPAWALQMLQDAVDHLSSDQPRIILHDTKVGAQQGFQFVPRAQPGEAWTHCIERSPLQDTFAHVLYPQRS